MTLGNITVRTLFIPSFDVQAIPVLLPELLTIVTNNEQYRPELQRRALVILHSIVNMLSNISGQELKQVHSVLSPMLGPWFAQFGRIFSSSADIQVKTETRASP